VGWGGGGGGGEFGVFGGGGVVGGGCESAFIVESAQTGQTLIVYLYSRRA